MRDMAQPSEKYTLRYQLVAMARDAMTIITVVSTLTVGVLFLAKPYTQPFFDLPEKLAQLQLQFAKLQLDLAEIREPRLVEFEGHALVIGDASAVYAPGETIRLLYNVRRNASCVTELEVRFFNVLDGTQLVTHSERAVQAPVTEDFQPFLVRFVIPQGLPDGMWTYQPRVIPFECGVYGPYLAAMSEPFTVKAKV